MLLRSDPGKITWPRIISPKMHPTDQMSTERRDDGGWREMIDDAEGRTIFFVSHAENDFGCSIIPGDDVGCHHERCSSRSGQAEIENLQCTIGFDDDIRRFQIAMDDASGMKMFDSTQHLIEKIGDSFMIQIHLNHLTEIGIHQFHHNVNIVEFFQRLRRRESVQQGDDLKGRDRPSPPSPPRCSWS